MPELMGALRFLVELVYLDCACIDLIHKQRQRQHILPELMLY